MTTNPVLTMATNHEPWQLTVTSICVGEALPTVPLLLPRIPCCNVVCAVLKYLIFCSFFLYFFVFFCVGIFSCFHAYEITHLGALKSTGPQFAVKE